MYIKSTSWIVRVAYWVDYPHFLPKQTTLCALFWRFVFAACLPFVGVLVVMLGYLHAWIYHFKETLTVTLMVASFLAIIFGVGFLVERVRKYRYRQWRDPNEVPNPLWQGLKSVKQKFCPIIEIREKSAREAARLRKKELE